MTDVETPIEYHDEEKVDDDFQRRQYYGGRVETVESCHDEKYVDVEWANMTGKVDDDLTRGTRGIRVSYVPICDVIRIADETFGHGGWKTSSSRCEVVSKLERGETWEVVVECTTRVSVKDGRCCENIGVGLAIYSEDMEYAAAIEKATDEASTDALKRCLKSFICAEDGEERKTARSGTRLNGGRVQQQQHPRRKSHDSGFSQ
jgi:hypothetical protein